MASEMDELIEFLSSSRLEVRKMAVEIVLGLTGSDDGVQKLAKKSSEVGPALLHLLNDKPEISKLAAEALVNLSQDERISIILILGGVIERIMNILNIKEYPSVKPLIMLLANLTQTEEGANRLLQVENGVAKGVFVLRLVRSCLVASDADISDDPYEYVASVLVNLTRIELGRKLVLDPNRGIFRQILPQIESRNSVRKQGVAGTVRNCCFEAATLLPNLLLASQFLWPALLLPLAGTRIYSKEDRDKMPAELATPLSFERPKETDSKVRTEAAEALYLLAVQEGGRRALWSVNAVKILKIGYEDEEDPQVMEAYERLGSLLVTDSLQHEDEQNSED